MKQDQHRPDQPVWAYKKTPGPKEVDETGPAQTRSAGLGVQENPWARFGAMRGHLRAKSLLSVHAHRGLSRKNSRLGYKTTWARFGAMQGSPSGQRFPAK